MKLFARGLAPLVAVVLAGSALAACSSGSSGGSSNSGRTGTGPTSGTNTAKTEATSITVSHGYTDAEAAEIKAQVSQWNRLNPTSQVKLVFNGGNDGALQKTVAGFTAGNYPDIAYEFGSSAAQLARQPKLVDLSGTVSASGFHWNDFYPSERQAATVNGKVVGIPSLVDNLSLVYNKKMFAAAGVPAPTNKWTWQDFRSAAAKLTNRSARTYGWAFINDGSEDTVWRYLAMLWQAGGDLLSTDNSKPAFDSSAGLAALQQLHDMAVTDKSVYLDTGSGNYQNLFNSGKIAMLWTGPWDLSGIDPKISYGVAYLPGNNGNHETISGPDLYLAFDHSAARADAAVAFVSWLTSAPVHLQFAIATGDLPLRQSETTLPQYKTFLAKYPSNKVFVDNLNNVKHVRPNIAAYTQVSTAIGKMVQAVLLGQDDPQSALDAGRDQVIAALAGR